MKHRSILIIVILVSLTIGANCFLVGCGSLISKGKGYGQEGHPYTGVTFDAYEFACLWELPPDNSEASDYVLYPFGIVGSLLFIIDIPFSLLIDTSFFPFDLAMTATNERISYRDICEYKKQK